MSHNAIIIATVPLPHEYTRHVDENLPLSSSGGFDVRFTSSCGESGRQIGRGCADQVTTEEIRDDVELSIC